MAWVDVSGSNNTLEYENTATAANTYADAPGTYSGGIRTYTTPGTGLVNKMYARTRIKGEINLSTYSEDYTVAANAGWAKWNSTATKDTAVEPLTGTTTANTIVPSTASHYFHGMYKVSSQASSTGSIYAKANGYNYLNIVFRKDAGDSQGVQFNLSDGTITASDRATGKITSVGDGWYRCSITPTNTDTSTQLWFNVTDGGTPNTGNFFSGPNWVPDGTKSMLMWGAMISDGLNIKKYKKTVAAVSTTIERGELSKDFYDATHVGF